MISSAGALTETAPATLMQLHEPIGRSGVIGRAAAMAPTIKLLPDDEMRSRRCRVKGPNVMERLLQRSREKLPKAFDDEGFSDHWRCGASLLIWMTTRTRGLTFDGRVSEDFKLLTGTWVRLAQLRLDMLACLAPLAADLVITGA